MSGLIYYYFLSALTIAVCLFATWKGGPPERAGAWLILGVIILGRICNYLLPHSVQPILQLLFDSITAMGLLIIAVRYASLWLGGAMILYAIQFSLHSYYMVTGRPNDYLHATINNLDFMGIRICLVVGTIIAWRGRIRARAEAAALEAAQAEPAASD